MAGVQRRLCKVNQIYPGVCDQFIFPVPSVSTRGLLVIVLMFQLISHFHRERGRWERAREVHEERGRCTRSEGGGRGAREV